MFFKSKRLLIPAFLFLALLMVVASVKMIPAHAAARESFHALDSGSNSLFPAFWDVNVSVFRNPRNTAPFSVSQSTAPVFTEQLPGIDFNPPTSLQPCISATGINDFTTPFTDVTPDILGNCTMTPLASGKEIAGANDLKNFEAVFTATLFVPHAGDVSFSFYQDDDTILSIGPLLGQPSRVSGPMVNAPAFDIAPFTRYQVVEAYNGANGDDPAEQPFTSVVNFPTGGTYPVELDYTECCRAPLALVVTPTES